MNGELSFTGNLDTINHVIPVDGANEPDSIRVKIKTIDEFTRNKVPLLMKIDVEGFELAVLQGARQTIENHGLKAMIVELNGSCRRYGVNESDIHAFLLNAGFTAAVYEPFDRKLKELDSYNPHSNTIYFRDASFIQKRLERSKKFRVLNRDI